MPPETASRPGPRPHARTRRDSPAPPWRPGAGSKAAALAIAALLGPHPAAAWGYEGHKVVATIARTYLTPKTRAAVDALIAADSDTLTAPDMAARATWADAWRSAGHRETAQWHFADLELDDPDPDAACFGHAPAATPASAGPAHACLVDRLVAFDRELADPATPQAERILALKYVLHFAGDLHQPLHASDHQDHGGNCVAVALGAARTTNLHSYWDTRLVEELDKDSDALAARLRAQITPAQKRTWERGDPAAWALESYGVSRRFVYQIGSRAGCDPNTAPTSLPRGYDATARRVAALQLEKAGVRLALLLNRAVGAGSRQQPTSGR